MKKVFMAMAIVAAMFAAAACSCGNNSQKAEACDSTCTEVCDSTKCCCDSTATVDTTVVVAE